jgi:voltage-gated potassium channel
MEIAAAISGETGVGQDSDDKATTPAAAPGKRRAPAHPHVVHQARASVPGRRGWIRSLLFTAGLLCLIALSVERVSGSLLFALIISVTGFAVAFHRYFPGSLFFSFAIANLTGIYACIFVLFVENDYREVDTAILPFGFIAPLAAFFAGTMWRRHAIRSVIASETLRDEGHFGRLIWWLGPVVAIGVLGLLIPQEGMTRIVLDGLFLAAMAAIAAVVFFTSRDVAIFLLDTGLLFEEFFDRAARLVIPVFAFLTFYSLTVIVFGSLYAAADHLAHVAHFRVDGILRELSFAESLYFSLTTLSMVGYGDIVPVAGPLRILVALELVCGIVLLLFGFNEIIGYSRERGRLSRRAG